MTTKSRKIHHGRRHKTAKRSLFKKIKNTTYRAIPIVKSGLKKVGTTAIKATPVIEKGLGGLYNSVLSGLNLGVKGVKKGIHMISSKKKQHKRSSRRH